MFCRCYAGGSKAVVDVALLDVAAKAMLLQLSPLPNAYAVCCFAVAGWQQGDS
jgi:hypothetical protein